MRLKSVLFVAVLHIGVGAASCAEPAEECVFPERAPETERVCEETFGLARVRELTNDRGGRVVEERLDERADGEYEHRRVVEYYRGDAIKTQSDWYCGRNVNDQPFCNSYRKTYDAAGRLVSDESDRADDFLDTSYRIKHTLVYDDNGHLESRHTTYNGSNPRIDRYTYLLDTANNPLTIELNEWGSITKRWTYTYDNQGRILTERIETQESWEEFNTWTYDASGNLVIESSTFTVQDYYGTGEEVRLWQKGYFYDTAGRLIAEEYDQHTDGIIDWRRSYSFDIAGNLLVDAFDEGADGDIDRQTTYAFDLDGRKTSEQWDWDGDQVADAGLVLLYDSFGRLQRREYDGVRGSFCAEIPFDGVPDAWDVLSYDAAGYLIAEESHGFSAPRPPPPSPTPRPRLSTACQQQLRESRSAGFRL